MISKKLFLLVFILFSFSFSVQAQFETNKKKIKLSIVPKKLPPKPVEAPKPFVEKKPETNIPALKFESQFNKKPEDELLKSVSINSKVEIKEGKIYEVKSASELFADKFNKKEGKVEERFKSDTFLGQFSSDSKTVRIACRDHEAPDGDRVRIWLNDRVAVEEILLDSSFKELYLDLQEGINKIEFEALNQGESGPNTAQFTAIDKNGKVITNNSWNLTTGVKAKIIIVKEEVLNKE